MRIPKNHVMQVAYVFHVTQYGHVVVCPKLAYRSDFDIAQLLDIITLAPQMHGSHSSQP